MTADHCGPACPFLACPDCRYQPDRQHVTTHDLNSTETERP